MSGRNPTPLRSTSQLLALVFGPVTASDSCETGDETGVDVPGTVTSTLVVIFIPAPATGVYLPPETSYVVPKTVSATLPSVGSVPTVVFAGTLNDAICHSGRGWTIGGGGGALRFRSRATLATGRCERALISEVTLGMSRL